jgi:hypothetical protein
VLLRVGSSAIVSLGVWFQTFWRIIVSLLTRIKQSRKNPEASSWAARSWRLRQYDPSKHWESFAKRQSVASQKIQIPILYLICSMILQHIYLIYKFDMLKNTCLQDMHISMYKFRICCLITMYPHKSVYFCGASTNEKYLLGFTFSVTIQTHNKTVHFSFLTLSAYYNHRNIAK